MLVFAAYSFVAGIRLGLLADIFLFLCLFLLFLLSVLVVLVLVVIIGVAVSRC